MALPFLIHKYPTESAKIKAKKIVTPSVPSFSVKVVISADMFESVNKKTLVHPFCKVGFLIANRLPEELRFNSDG